MTVSLGGPLLICALLSLVRDQVPSDNAALLLVLLVVGVATSGRRGTGVVAALSCAVWFDFFLTEPFGRFTISDRDDLETAVLLTVVGLAVTEIAIWGRRQQAGAARREGYLDGLVSASAMIAGGEASSSAVVDFVGRQLCDVLDLTSAVFVRGPAGAHPRLHHDGSVTHHDRVVDVDRTGLPTWDVVELPVESGGIVHGCFLLMNASHVVWPTPEQRRIAVTLADQAGVALAGPRPAAVRDQGI